MTIAYKMIHETFTTGHARPAGAADHRRLSQRPVPAAGEPLAVPPGRERACEVEFFIKYEFQSRTLGMLMGAMFEHVFRRFADAFERRADQIYGRSTS